MGAHDADLYGWAVARAALLRLLADLLKWSVQPGDRGASWALTIREERRRVQLLLDDRASLRAELERQAVPAHCSWSLAQIFEEDFFPE